MIPPKRVSERLTRTVGRFQEVLKTAKDRDVNESDTVSVIKDMLAEIFGYDKYLEITSEFAVRGTYCDLAIKVENKVEFLLEAKAVGIELKDSHLRQAIEYGANNGVPWIVLTNGIIWRVYRLRFEQPIDYDLICTIDFAAIDPNNEEHQEMLFVLCKEGLGKDARGEFHERILTVNRFILGALLLGDEVLSVLRRELRKLSDGILVTPEEITKVLTNEVLKRDVLDGDEAGRAQSRIRRFHAKTSKRPKETGTTHEEKMSDSDPQQAPVPAPSASPSDAAGDSSGSSPIV